MTQEYRQYVYSPPPGAVDILLIRHGESEAAKPGESFPMLDGHGDPALRPEGHAQAEAVAVSLADEPLDAIYVTTLQRTHQTAAPLAAQRKLAPVIEADLREVCLGEWDGGLYRIKLAERHPVFEKVFGEGEWGHVPGAETTAELHMRVHSALLRMAERHRDQMPLLFMAG